MHELEARSTARSFPHRHLHEAPIELWPPQHLPRAPADKLAPIKGDLAERDPKSFFGLCTLANYFESNESNAVLSVVCKGNTILGVIDGGGGVSIITKCC